MRPHLFLLILPFAVAILLAACGDDRDTYLDGKVRASRAEDAPVEIFLTKRPERAYDEIAVLRFETPDDGNELVAELKERTRDKGGDGCILTPRGDRDDITEAVVIVWK